MDESRGKPKPAVVCRRPRFTRTATSLHHIGLIDKATMREFDASCLTAIVPSYSESLRSASRRASVKACSPAA